MVVVAKVREEGTGHWTVFVGSTVVMATMHEPVAQQVARSINALQRLPPADREVVREALA